MSDLWLAVHLPQLPLDSLMRGRHHHGPLAIYDHQGPQQWIHSANPAARHVAIEPGMRVTAALGVCHELELLPREPVRERAALAGIADWSFQFSDRIALSPPHTVLLEIGGSLRLFGGHSRLCAAVANGMSELGYRSHLATAPTPLGAELLAWAGKPATAFDRIQLTRLLHPLPLTTLPLAPLALERLAALGLVNLGDCLRLPRNGLTRRFGTELLLILDRAFGHIDDPRPRHVPPARFEHTLWLPSAATAATALQFAAQRLLLELTGFLRGRGAGVTAITLHLHHARASQETLQLTLVAPSRDQAHLLTLLKERLEHHTLAAAVEGLTLLAEQIAPLSQQDQALFQTVETETPGWQRWLERLTAHLGCQAVYSPALVADHRPLRAWCPLPPNPTATTPPAALPTGHRPVWLLRPNTPSPPLEQGIGLANVALLQPPERIESGWWDGDEQRGEWRVVATTNGIHGWIYQPDQGPAQGVGLFG